jgi:hypothetical protein
LTLWSGGFSWLLHPILSLGRVLAGPVV